MNKAEMLNALNLINERLAFHGIQGEVGLYGGAVMCLALNAREGTHDLDAVFDPKMAIMEIAKEVGEVLGLEQGWFNDGVKGFISENNDMVPFQTLSHLNIYVASPEYMFAMKALSCRLDHHSEVGDIKHLMQHIGINTIEQAEKIIGKYYPANRIQQKTLYMLMEILEG